MAFNLGVDASVETVHFKNCYSGAVAKCRLERNTIIFESQSPSTLAVFKEAITRQANFRRTVLNETTTTSPEALLGFLALFQQNLTYQLSLAKEMTVLDAVKEVTHSEGASASEGSAPPAWLPSDFHAVYQDGERIRKEFKEKGTVLEYICGVIVGAHVDYHRLQGLTARSDPASVREAVLSGEWDRLQGLVSGGDSSGAEQSAPTRRGSSQWQPYHGREADPVGLEGDSLE